MQSDLTGGIFAMRNPSAREKKGILVALRVICIGREEGVSCKLDLKGCLPLAMKSVGRSDTSKEHACST